MSILRRGEQSGEFTVEMNPLKVHGCVGVTPAALMAIAALVSSLLLRTSALVWVAGSVHRKKHPPFI